MKYSTTLFPRFLANTSKPSTFILYACIYFFIKSLFPRNKKVRSPHTVKSNYDQERQIELDNLKKLNWESYVYFSGELRDFFLLNDRIEWGALSAPRKILLDKLEEKIKTHAFPGAVIVEVGSGNGRNLCYLRSKFPDLSFVGLELSDSSVELSSAAVEKFDLDNITFHVANACEPWPQFKGQDNVAVCYSSFALEMMPRIFPKAVDQMLNISKNAVVFFEPVHEYWPKNLRGLASRLRVFELDRLSGLPEYLQKKVKDSKWVIRACARAGVGLNPINEMVLIEVVKTK